MKSWLCSPLATNYLLSLLKNGPPYQNKYLQISKDLKVKDGFISTNQLFVSPSYNAKTQYDISDIIVEKLEFGRRHDATQCITKWINQYGRFNGVPIERYISPSTTSLLCNISGYKDVWKCSQPSTAMKVHNSFSYTEDIKYEARLIELPFNDDDFKLVIIVPNEVGSLIKLFDTLVADGLHAAVRCVQPLFTFSTVLEAPSIEFTSEDHVHFAENSRSNGVIVTGAQIGNVQINENGANISVLTLLSSTDKSMASVDEQPLQAQLPFYFAVLYKDIAVFTGRYVNETDIKV